MTNNLITRYCTAHTGKQVEFTNEWIETCRNFNNDNALSKSDIYYFKFMLP